MPSAETAVGHEVAPVVPTSVVPVVPGSAIYVALYPVGVNP